MKNKIKSISLLLRVLSVCMVIFFSSCRKEHADLIVHNALIYTVDSSFSTAESFAIKDGKFVAVGTYKEILRKYSSAQIIDAKGKAIYPGLIDSHCHFYQYGEGLQQVDLVGTKSFDEVLQKISDYAKTNKSEWIIGRGWDQNDWNVKEYPNLKKLDSLFPSIPVYLERIDGHAVLVNSEALRRAKITIDTKISGGLIEVKDKKLSGILIDNAVTLIKKAIPNPSKEEIKTALLSAQKKCTAVGLTTVDDAGLSKNIIDLIDELQKSGELKMRVYAMLTDNKENFDFYLKNGPYKTDMLDVRSFKFYADGALGSRGACLLKPYSDKSNEYGLLLNSTNYFDSISKILFAKGFQMNTHCIGDSAVRLISSIYLSTLFSNKASNHVPLEYRWRIEHAQVVDPKDLSKFSGIIPSVQPTHATSDMYWAEQRLGPERIKYAYAYSSLLKTTGKIALGTDFPVENINPFYTFYAAVARRDLKGFPENGFQMENYLSRENTIRGMTIWGAFANFEDNEKGSIEVGKFADFIILDNDLMKCEIEKVPAIKVISTYINGELIYHEENK
jgi:predicted amidohydrolase YtcJ